MRIKNISVQNSLPVKQFVVEDISDLVVIAGPNGVGKSRLVAALLTELQNLTGSGIKFIVQATTQEEAAQWGKKELDTTNSSDANALRSLLQQNRQRTKLKSSIFYYESNRSIQQIQPLKYQWDMPDPWEEQISWNLTFGSLAGRFQDTLHSIFKKIQTQKTLIANQAINLKQKGYSSMNLEFNDPLDPFREAFYKLLGPKQLIKADPQNNTLWFEHDGQEYNINALSSGEREVLNITFDFLLRSPSDCIIFFDEPELHLHPELSSKLISTLKSIGRNNQFILCSHSPDIISSSLDDTVVFLTPANTEGKNQAVVLKQDDQSTEALHRLGHSIGVVSLGKKIVLIEGTKSSLDKQTYVHILRNRFPNLVLLPSGGKGNLSSFDNIADQILKKSLWGIDFFMLADRDCIGVSEPDQLAIKGRFRTLKKYHLENYFLDGSILAKIFQAMEPSTSWLCNTDQVELKLREIASSYISYATSLIVANEIRRQAGNVDIMPKGVVQKSLPELTALLTDRISKESNRLSSILTPSEIQTLTCSIYNQLQSSIESDSGDWKYQIPGKQILSQFCSQANISEGRLKTLYIQESENAANNPFDEIVQIFNDFSTCP